MKIFGNAVGYYNSLGKTVMLVDEYNNEFVGVVVGEETVFTATAADIAKGKVAGTNDGVTVGTHECE
jgi:hypothetical protein